MKFQVFTMVRNNWLDGLYLEFRARLFEARFMKAKLSLEQVKELEMRNAECWNKIARILMDLDRIEKDDDAIIDECFEVFGEEPKGFYMTRNALNNKKPQIVDFLDDIVGFKSTSSDGNFVVYYLKKMYQYLTETELVYVDETLKNEMFERLKLVETI